MRFQHLAFFLLIILVACQNSFDSDNVYDSELVLEDFDYFEEEIPFSKTAYGASVNHDDMAALGRILFYDKRLSQNNSIACASCHKQEIGFSDNKIFSTGVRNYETTRNAMQLVNNAYQIAHFWEGKEGKIEDHVLSPVSNHIEMGMKDVNELVEKLKGITAYNTLFNQVYGEEISEELITNSLSTFVASIISYNSKFDKGEEINFANFTISEVAGKDLFFGKAKCFNCHGGDHYSASWRKNANIGLEMNYDDQGGGNGRFKVPSLRNIALTAPYMHDGRFETLEEVVDHYANGVRNHPHLDWALTTPIALDELESKQLVDFLHTLTDHQLINDEKFSNPF